MNQLVILTKWLTFFQVPGRKETAMADTTTRKNKKDQSVRKILNAALLVFATQGYNGARVDAIARKAGVNKAMIYYRIGNKQLIAD
jgi:AcrR family transcriptional regulator